MVLINTDIHIPDTQVSPTDLAIAFIHSNSYEQGMFLEILGRETDRMQ